MPRLDGRAAVVTGGARGIGEGMVRRFVAEGARWTATFQTSSNHTFGSTWLWGSGVAPGVLRPAGSIACPQ